MASGKILAILGGILTILGTYLFAIFGGSFPGSGTGFILNLGDLFGNAEAIALYTGLDILVIFLLDFLFIIFLLSGFFQIFGRKSKFISFLFSLFPLIVGSIIMIFFYTEILGPTTAMFVIYFSSLHYGGFYPIIVNIGSVGLGTYLLVAGGLLGFISGFLDRD